MTGDVCDCGICEVETCDVCGSLVTFVDPDGGAWCLACYVTYMDNFFEAVWLRQWEASQ